MSKLYSNISIIIITILLCLTVYFSLTTGTIHITLADIWNNLVNGETNNFDSVFDLRLPRIIIAVLCGTMLAISGALLQAVLQNPLADANLLGVTTGALVFRNLIMLTLPNLYFYIPFFSFLGGMLPFLLLFIITMKFRLSSTSMILIGVALYASLSGILELLTQNPLLSLPQGLTMKTWTDVYIILVTACLSIPIVMLLSFKVNLLMLDVKQAQSIGFNMILYRLIIGLIAVVLASVSATIIGSLAFVGLIVPHIARKIGGGNYKRIIPLSMLCGATLVLIADLIGRTILAPIEVPANVITMMIGGPVLIIMICRGVVNNVYRSS